jgi:hypothetical protein
MSFPRRPNQPISQSEPLALSLREDLLLCFKRLRAFIAETDFVTMNEMNPKVDGFLEKTKKWRQEFERLRMVCLDCGLAEELRWVNLVTRIRKVT